MNDFWQGVIVGAFVVNFISNVLVKIMFKLVGAVVHDTRDKLKDK